MLVFFWVCFGVGVGYTVIAFLLGEFLSAFEVDVDADGSVDGSVSPLKPTVIAAFVTVFGGAGLILSRFMDIYIVLPLAGVIGAGVAFLLFRFVVLPLSRAYNTSAVELQSLIGHTAKVTEKIFQGGYGQITYWVHGNTHSAPAKAEDGGEIARNEVVEIIYIQDSTYFVRKKYAEETTGN